MRKNSGSFINRVAKRAGSCLNNDIWGMRIRNYKRKRDIVHRIHGFSNDFGMETKVRERSGIVVDWITGQFRGHRWGKVGRNLAGIIYILVKYNYRETGGNLKLPCTQGDITVSNLAAGMIPVDHQTRSHIAVIPPKTNNVFINSGLAEPVELLQTSSAKMPSMKKRGSAKYSCHA